MVEWYLEATTAGKTGAVTLQELKLLWPRAVERYRLAHGNQQHSNVARLMISLSEDDLDAVFRSMIGAPATVLRLPSDHDNLAYQRLLMHVDGLFNAQRPDIADLDRFEPDLPRNVHIGIELETSLVIIGKSHKEVVHKDDELRVEADTETDGGGFLEFVVLKTPSLAGIRGRARRCVASANRLLTLPVDSKGQCNAKSRDVFGPGTNMSASTSLTFRCEEPCEATPQFTMGVPLDRMAVYLESAMKASGSQQEKLAALTALKQKVFVLNQTKPYHTDARWRGFLLLFALYVHDLQTWRPNNDSDEGPKNAVTVMTRTSFREMYKYLVEATKPTQVVAASDKTEMARVGKEVMAYVERQKGKKTDWEKARLIPAKYPWASEENAMTQCDHTLEEWIRSIVEGISNEGYLEQVIGPAPCDGDPDLLCPPDGFDNLDPRYSLGAMKMDGDLVVIEHRSPALVIEGNIDTSFWEDFAVEVFRFASSVLAGRVHGD